MHLRGTRKAQCATQMEHRAGRVLCAAWVRKRIGAVKQRPPSPALVSGDGAPRQGPEGSAQCAGDRFKNTCFELDISKSIVLSCAEAWHQAISVSVVYSFGALASGRGSVLRAEPHPRGAPVRCRRRAFVVCRRAWRAARARQHRASAACPCRPTGLDATSRSRIHEAGTPPLRTLGRGRARAAAGVVRRCQTSRRRPPTPGRSTPSRSQPRSRAPGRRPL